MHTRRAHHDSDVVYLLTVANIIKTMAVSHVTPAADTLRMVAHCHAHKLHPNAASEAAFNALLSSHPQVDQFVGHLLGERCRCSPMCSILAERYDFRHRQLVTLPLVMIYVQRREWHNVERWMRHFGRYTKDVGNCKKMVAASIGREQDDARWQRVAEVIQTALVMDDLESDSPRSK